MLRSRQVLELFLIEFLDKNFLILLNLLINSIISYLDLTKSELDIYFSEYDLKRLDLYAKNMVDHHLITDLLPPLAKLHFTCRFKGVEVGAIQAVSFVCRIDWFTFDELGRLWLSNERFPLGSTPGPRASA